MDKAKSLRKALHLLELLSVDQVRSTKSLGVEVGVDARTIKDYADVGPIIPQTATAVEHRTLLLTCPGPAIVPP